MPVREELLERFQKRLGYNFKNGTLLDEALTHASYAKDRGSSFFNERLEFLGDAVLELISSWMLYKKFSEYDEGKLTRLRSQLVRGTALVAWANKMELGKLIKTGKCLKGKVTESMLEDAAEAIFGAIFIDSDYATVCTVALRFFKERIEDGICDSLDPKTMLQQLTQADCNSKVPRYVTVFRPLPGEDVPFEVSLYIDDVKTSNGFGKNIQEAEFAAAKKALDKLTQNKK